ncbi:MAG: hypothetical protein EBQ92_08275 [Proteobacteria bacterium]|nr:hypothetical protein [Pseudomonadota bacterium]
MPPQFTQNLIPLERIEQSLQLEPVLFVLFTALSSFLVYTIGLRSLSPSRHRNLRTLFKNLLGHVFLGLGLLTFFWILRGETIAIPKLVPFVGIATVLWGAIILIKSFRIFSFEYLFFMNMQTGVPLLLVNMLTLLMSVVLGSWIATSVFGFRLAPVLATSALFSIVVGLALQETLGNLFSGIALQIDKPYTLGDWIEVQTGTQKLIGHVHEVTWRATILTSLTEEWITIPNRIVAQSQVLNFSKTKNPILRSQVFRLPYSAPIQEIRKILVQSIQDIKGINRFSEPTVLLVEAAESWLTVKLVYAVKDFPDQFRVADEVIEKCVESLRNRGISLVGPVMRITQEKTA